MSTYAIPPHEVAERAVVLGGEGTVAVVTVTSEADLRWANSMLTTNGERTSLSLTVVCTAPVDGGTAIGVASGRAADQSEIDDLVAQASRAAQAGTAADDAGPLIDSATPATDWNQPIATTSGAAFAILAPELGDAFARGRADGIEHFGYAEHQVSTVFVASSAGLRLRHSQPTARVEATAKSQSRTRSSWAGRAGREMTEFTFGDVDAELRRGLAWQATPRTIEPGRHTVILTPSAVTDLMIYQYWTSSARDAAEGHTVFSAPGGGTRIGERLTESPITISSDPYDAEIAGAPFTTAPWSSGLTSAFDIGLPLEKTTWIDQGSLAHLVTTRHAASELGLAVAPLVDNLRLTHSEGHGTLDDVIARTQHGLLITCLWYIREVDPRSLLLTGLTRDGVYLIENGQVVGSVGNFRFNMSPEDVLSQTIDAGDTVMTLPREWGEDFARAAAPPLVVDGFNLSTRSDAL